MLEKILPAALALLFLTGVAPPAPGTNEPPTTQQASTKQIDPKPMDLTWQQQQNIFAYGAASMLNQCAAQPSNLWCSKVRLPERMLSPYEIMNISLDTKANFNYLADVEDNWRVHSSEVLTKQTWKGDCDDLTSTTLDMLVRNGQPRNKIWFVLADVEHKNMLDHLIGMIQDADGHFWIVGDTSSQNAYPASQMKYRIVAVANGSDPMTWVDPHTVEAFPASALQNNPIAPPPPAPIVIKLTSVEDILNLKK